MTIIGYIKRIYGKRNLVRKLKKIDSEDIEIFSFKDIKTYAKIIDIYDGDTFKIIFRYNKKFIKVKCRLFGIDTPEIRTRNSEEKKRGYKAKLFVEKIVNEHNGIMFVNLLSFDKYGRLLAEVYTENKESLADLLILNHLGYEYYGGTKK
jgi:micrococcal nuclease